MGTLEASQRSPAAPTSADTTPPSPSRLGPTLERRSPREAWRPGAGGRQSHLRVDAVRGVDACVLWTEARSRQPGSFPAPA